MLNYSNNSFYLLICIAILNIIFRFLRTYYRIEYLEMFYSFHGFIFDCIILNIDVK